MEAERTLRVDFNDSTIRIAVAAIVFETFRRSLWPLAITGFLALGALMLTQTLVPSWGGWLVPFLCFLVIASLFWGGVIFVSYAVTMRDSRRLFREMPSHSVEFRVNETGISVVSPAWSGTVAWSQVRRFVQRRAMSLISLGRVEFARGPNRSVTVHSVLGDEVLSGESLLSLWRLPLMWVRPGMRELFLVVPRELSESDWLRHKLRRDLQSS